MGWRKGSKFSFATGRKANSKRDDQRYDDLTKTSSHPSITAPSFSSGPSERHMRYDDSSTTTVSSKAQRLLGTAPPPFRAMNGQSSVPASPGYRSIKTSDGASDYNDKASSIGMEHGTYRLPMRPSVSNRASSNILPSSIPFFGDEMKGSNASTFSTSLQPAKSSSTLRSHYDAQTSPLAISQQTSDSAVRDMALRKGKSQINLHVTSPLSHELESESRHDRRGKPAKLDLSKLFPKPKGQEFGVSLLSPNKMVNSPTAMSTNSDFFPHPMTREPTPTLKTPTKLTKSPRKPPMQSVQSKRPTSPVRSHQRDAYDSAKVNVRRPPQGIQHWFEGLSEDSDDLDEEQAPVHAPIPVNPARQYPAVKANPHNQQFREPTLSSQQLPQSERYLQDPRKLPRNHAHSYGTHRLNSPSTYSVQSQSSLGTARTKESAFSKSNLQDSSILSFSSSEDEGETRRSSRRNTYARTSVGPADEHGDIIIGQAHAFDLRPQLHSRRPSAGKLSLMSTSTNAATIEVMYTPEPPYTPVTRTSTSSKRASHVRQPSVIHEVDDGRPKTAHHRSQSPSSTSVRTSKSEPRSEEIRKFMAVTPEEEALLDALRKKRAAMAQQNATKSHDSKSKKDTSFKQEEAHHRTPEKSSSKKDRRTSAFLAAETPPSVSPMRVVETMKGGRRSYAPDSFSLLAPPKGRASVVPQTSAAPILLPSTSYSDLKSERGSRASNNHNAKPRLSAQEFSPIDLFPSPTPTASAASPTTIDHPSPLSSPVTPRLHSGEDDVDVKVASSEPSWNGDGEEVTVLETGEINLPSGSIKAEDTQSGHQRRRTASSGSAVPLTLPAKYQPTEPRDLVPVTEASSRPTSVVEPIETLPKPPTKSVTRNPSLSINTTGLSRSKHGSIMSNRTSSPNRSVYDRRLSRQTSRAGSLASSNSIRRDSVAVGTASTRCSVSEDVLAAWGSLGGMRDARW